MHRLEYGPPVFIPSIIGVSVDQDLLARSAELNSCERRQATSRPELRAVVRLAGGRCVHAARVAFVVLALALTPTDLWAQQWTLMDGAARDVGVGANGAVWVIGTNPVSGGHDIWRRNPDNKGWTAVPGGAQRIAVGPDGNAWVVNDSQTIYRYDGTKWNATSGRAHDIAVGPNGTVWVIGTTVEGSDYGIYRSTDQGRSWMKIPGAAVRIAVDHKNQGWVVNKSNMIFRFDGSGWVQMPGTAKDIGAGPDGAVWVIGTDGSIHRWDQAKSTWARMTGGAREISVGPSGVVWVVNDSNQIWSTGLAAPASAPPLPPHQPTTGAVNDSAARAADGPLSPEKLEKEELEREKLEKEEIEKEEIEKKRQELEKEEVEKRKKAYEPEGSAHPFLINCSGKTIIVKTYNSDDVVKLVPFAFLSLANGQKSGLASRICGLDVPGVGMGKITGYNVIVNGGMKATNSAAYKDGCKSFIP